MSWKHGIWFRRTGLVPDNRITNLDIKQGPVMRALGISPFAVQTGGYFGLLAVPEIRIKGMEHEEELREPVCSYANPLQLAMGPTGLIAQTAPLSTNQKILDELVNEQVRIRQLRKMQII